MRKWDIIFKTTLSILFIFIGVIIIHGISLYFSDVTYPYPTIAGDVHNWFEQFVIDVAFIMIGVGIPFVIDVVLLIISVVKLRNSSK